MIYARREKNHAFRPLWDDESDKFSCVGGTTRSLLRHLRNVRDIKAPEESII